MVIDHTLFELSHTGNTLTLCVQINMLERRAIKFTPETFDQWLAELTRIRAAWRRDRQKITVEYYTLLGVPSSATDDEVRDAYRVAAKRHHPDVAGDTAAMQQLNDAYAVLGDPQRRQLYDRTL